MWFIIFAIIFVINIGLFDYSSITATIDITGGFVTFIIPRTNGGYVIGKDRSFEFLDWDTATLTHVAEVDQGTKNRLNDAKCDAAGRLWAG